MKWTLFERLRAAIDSERSATLVTRLADGVQCLFDGSHWDEISFNPDMDNSLIIGGSLPDSQELMTTTFGSLTEAAWLSDVTLGALVDLGYQVADVSPDAPGIRVSDLLA